MIVGKNVAVEVKGNTLHIAVDLAAEGAPSKSGKSTLIGTTNGNIQVPDSKGTILFSVNVFQPNK
jgi:Fe-S cluster assembly ATPase SufC